MESIHPLFLIQWLLGDITNLIGCIFTNQLPTSLYTAIYYCAMDVLMLAQYFYYLFKNRKKLKPTGTENISVNEETSALVPKSTLSVFLLMGVFSLTYLYILPNNTPTTMHVGRTLQSVDICNPNIPLSLAETIIGDVSAWISGILYFTARIPQIYLNFKRKSVEGLSFPMFFCAICGNLCYGLSVLILGVDDWSEWMRSTFP